MKGIPKKTKFTRDITLAELVDLKVKLENLPSLSAVEKATLDHETAIEHLYYSSKIEGTILTDKSIDNAIYGSQVQASKN